MKEPVKILLTIAAIVAVLVYTIFNYLRGGISTMYFLVYLAILLLPLMNMINILIRNRKDR